MLVSIIAAFMVSGLIYVTAEGRPDLAYVEGKVRDGLAPIYGAVSGVTGFFRHWVNTIRNYSRLEQENAELLQGNRADETQACRFAVHGRGECQS